MPVPAPFSVFYPQFPGLNMNYMIPVAPSESSASPEAAPPAAAGFAQPMMPFYPYGEGVGAVPMVMTSEGVLVPAAAQPMEGATPFAAAGFGRGEGPPRRESGGKKRG